MKNFLFLILFVPSLAFAQKLVLIEQFTNASCGSCANYTPQVVQYADENSDKVQLITYHGPYPGRDSMYTENSEDIDIRMSYYELFSVPSSIIDGNHFKGSSFSLLQNINETIPLRFSDETDYFIDFENVSLVGKYVSGNINVIKSDEIENSNTTLYIALVEKIIFKSDYASSPGSNSETKYSYVVRKMLSNPYGEFIEFDENSFDLFFDYNTNNFKDLNKMRVVAFIQDNDTKEIYQSNYIDVSPTLSINYNNNSKIQVFPNPVNEILKISIDQSFSEVHLNIYDVQGKIIEKLNIEGKKGVYEHNVSKLEKGMYFIQMKDQYYKFIKN